MAASAATSSANGEVLAADQLVETGPLAKLSLANEALSRRLCDTGDTVAPMPKATPRLMWEPPETMLCTRVNLAPGPGPADAAHQVDRGVDQLFETKAHHQGRHQQQPGVGHQVVLVEGHLNAVDSARYLIHWKCVCVPGWVGFSADSQAFLRLSVWWIEDKAPGRLGRHHRLAGAHVRAGSSRRGDSRPATGVLAGRLIDGEGE